jgi:hypothetical protein
MDVAVNGRALILLISNKWDVSLDFIVRELRNRGIDFLRLNTEDLPHSDCAVVLPNGSFLLSDGKKTFEVNKSLKSVLFRRPGKPFEEAGVGIKDKSILTYCREQWHALVEGLLGIKGVLWINHPGANDLMECKIVQIEKASEIGFNIPRTCVTASKERAEKFIKSCGGYVVAKGLYSSVIEYPERDYFVFTTLIRTLADVHQSELGMAPVIFQEYISDKTDYRVTVVGNQLFAVRIASTSGTAIPVDWRTQKEGLVFIPSELPEDIRVKCLNLVSESGLVFGAIDLVQVEDRFYFLEINPNGEWGWLQSSAGLPIAEAIVDSLVTGTASQEVFRH